jgi:hypothetical protein
MIGRVNDLRTRLSILFWPHLVLNISEADRSERFTTITRFFFEKVIFEMFKENNQAVASNTYLPCIWLKFVFQNKAETRSPRDTLCFCFILIKKNDCDSLPEESNRVIGNPITRQQIKENTHNYLF